jgi:integrating conjugative element protein (TIGR03746 family)
VRGVQEIPGHGLEERRVDLLGPGIWVVWLDLDLFDSVKGMTVKQTAIRYPLRVVRLAIDPETNPWGLALDGYGAEGPHRLRESDLAEAKQDEGQAG